MIARLFLVAVFSVAFATKQVGDFRQGDFFGEETLRDMIEAMDEKILAMSMATETAIRIMKERGCVIMNWMMFNACPSARNSLQEIVAETVSKAMEEKKPLDTFVCIKTRAQESYRRVNDAGRGRLKNLIYDNVKNITDTGEDFRLSLKHLNDYVSDLYIEKSVELNNAADDAAKKKILNYVKQKMAAVETLLKNLEGRLYDLKSEAYHQLRVISWGITFLLAMIYTEEVAKIEQCVP